MGIWGARVLIVDDGEGILDAVGGQLGARGADVITVSTAGAALATVIGVTPDVLVVDVTAPGLDGVGLLRAVRALSPEKGGQIPAVAVVESAPESELVDAWREAGFQGQLMMPFEPAELVDMVERLAGRAVERRRSALDRRHWPRDVFRDRRAEVRGEWPTAWPENGYF